MGAWGGVTVVRKFSFMEGCDGHVGGIKGCGEV